MALPEPMFCSQQIKIPPELPDILKQYTKAAIRTQPHDLLQWSAAYFECLSNGLPLPAKERFEMPMGTQKSDTDLTLGLLKVLHKQLSSEIFVSNALLKQKWIDLCLPQGELKNILELDNFGNEVEWLKFLALGCSALGSSIQVTLKHVCEILTDDPEGGAARIPFETFSNLYKYLAKIDGEISQSKVEDALFALQAEAEKQDGMIQPRNFLNTACPPLS
ncbi:ropporin-1-like protein [Bombina bombina]|uniref:ropporin-1-like protein n=1 Tax=Bombina bombina TaxID=8345 RepID=UPI00235A8423|nr:ropporin-1-like protein [Bombina bombina]XP_053570566.1 ropporin-1-like protein [Bombina bombina]